MLDCLRLGPYFQTYFTIGSLAPQKLDLDDLKTMAEMSD